MWGAERSWAVLLFTFLSAASDCTSSVVYWPFAGSFLPRYISWMAVGEGLSGVVAALFVQVQYPLRPVYFACVCVCVRARACECVCVCALSQCCI